MSEKLRECPFCGSEVKMEFPALHRYRINCANCALVMWDDTENKLIKMWNTRHEPKHETVAEWEKRTGEIYPDDGPVWCKNDRYR